MQAMLGTVNFQRVVFDWFRFFLVTRRFMETKPALYHFLSRKFLLIVIDARLWRILQKTWLRT
jgi:hypothetical protein